MSVAHERYLRNATYTITSAVVKPHISRYVYAIAVAGGLIFATLLLFIFLEVIDHSRMKSLNNLEHLTASALQNKEYLSVAYKGPLTATRSEQQQSKLIPICCRLTDVEKQHITMQCLIVRKLHKRRKLVRWLACFPVIALEWFLTAIAFKMTFDGGIWAVSICIVLILCLIVSILYWYVLERRYPRSRDYLIIQFKPDYEESISSCYDFNYNNIKQ
ncbi:hypothetical protein TRVA0_006S00210 [Trichomonascus vanleenenianus]|uniref:uncharacterized protein n=1 Tax=Trichomonascus vanleenenianus TaxID=2268995 RepID=UPI003ECB79BD